MSAAEPESPGPATARPADAPRARSRWQVGLRTLFLLVVASAVWLAYFINRKHNEATRARIAVMRPLARELVVDDPALAAAVKLPELWFDENRWDFYLPPGAYRLCLATRAVDQDGLSPVVATAPLRPGRHELELEQARIPGGWRVTAAWDGSGRLVADEQAGWDPSNGSSGGGLFSASTQTSANEPLVLFRRRFYRAGPNNTIVPPTGAADGILLWVERLPDQAPAADVLIP